MGCNKMKKKLANIIVIGEGHTRGYCNIVKESAKALFQRKEIDKESLDKIVKACDKKIEEIDKIEKNSPQDFRVNYYGS